MLHTAHFDNIIVPPFIDFKTNGLMLFVFSPHLRELDNIIFYTLFIHLFSTELHSMELHSTELHFKKRYRLIMEFYLKVF